MHKVRGSRAPYACACLLVPCLHAGAWDAGGHESCTSWTPSQPLAELAKGGVGESVVQYELLKHEKFESGRRTRGRAEHTIPFPPGYVLPILTHTVRLNEIWLRGSL